MKIFPNLSENEKKVLGLIAGEDSINSGKLYEKYCKNSKEPLTQRSFRDIISRLESLNLVSAPLVEGGIRGKTRAISLKISKSALEEMLSAPKRN